MLPQLLIFASAAVVFGLGTIHLIYTFTSDNFWPRETAVADHMARVAPRISGQTTMWRAWVGFNASHSLGAMLFGAVYGYFSIFEFQLLLRATFLLWVGAFFLGSFVVLAKRYWFSVPLIGLLISSALFGAGVVFALHSS